MWGAFFTILPSPGGPKSPFAAKHLHYAKLHAPKRPKWTQIGIDS